MNEDVKLIQEEFIKEKFPDQKIQELLLDSYGSVYVHWLENKLIQERRNFQTRIKELLFEERQNSVCL